MARIFPNILIYVCTLAQSVIKMATNFNPKKFKKIVLEGVMHTSTRCVTVIDMTLMCNSFVRHARLHEASKDNQSGRCKKKKAAGCPHLL